MGFKRRHYARYEIAKRSHPDTTILASKDTAHWNWILIEMPLVHHYELPWTCRSKWIGEFDVNFQTTNSGLASLHNPWPTFHKGCLQAWWWWQAFYPAGIPWYTLVNHAWPNKPPPPPHNWPAAHSGKELGRVAEPAVQKGWASYQSDNWHLCFEIIQKMCNRHFFIFFFFVTCYNRKGEISNFMCESWWL